MAELWRVAFSVAGIGAVALCVLWLLYKRWLSLAIFSRLGRRHTYNLMLAFLVLTFVAVLAGIVAYISRDKDGVNPALFIGPLAIVVAAVVYLVAMGSHHPDRKVRTSPGRSERPTKTPPAMLAERPAKGHRTLTESIHGNELFRPRIPSPMASAPAQPPEGRIYVHQQPHEIVASLAGMTGIQAESFATRTYYGKWMRLTLPVHDVQSRIDLTVALEPPAPTDGNRHDPRLVFARLHPGYDESHVSHLRPGEVITIEGKICSVVPFSLEECTLLG